MNLSTHRWRFVPLGLPGKIAAVGLLCALFVLCTSLMDGGSGVVPSALWNMPYLAAWWYAPLHMVANAVPGLLLALLLLAATRKALLSFLLSYLLQALVYGINALKVANLGSPLTPTDFHMVGQMGEGGGELLSGYLPHSAWPYLLILAAIAAVIALIRYEPPLLARRPRTARVVGGAALVVLLGSLLGGSEAWGVLYNRDLLGMQPWSAKATAKQTGLISELQLFRLQYGSKREKPDVNAALQLMANYDTSVQHLDSNTPAPGKADDKPDIVVILSESFFDPTILNGYGSNVDFMPNLHRLARHGVSGQMHSPTFGGGTIRTEFEVLTGIPLRYFPSIMFPYLQLNQKVIPGIVRLLKSHGYQAIAVHGGDPHFWNRIAAFKALGFDKFVSHDDFPADDSANDGRYMSDKAFTDELLRQLPDDGPPRFVLGISIEAHGPYDQPYGIDTRVRDAIPVPPGLTGDARTQLQNYIYHIRHADQQLGRLADTLAKRKRPTLIVFFGDHLPALMSTYQQDGFRNGKGFLVQTVPYLLIDTSRLNTAKPVTDNVASWELPGMLLARTSIRDNYFTLTQVLAPELEALTRAPDAPRPDETPAQEQLDKGMSNVARLRLKGKLDGLWPRAAAMATERSSGGGASSSTPAGKAPETNAAHP